MRLSNLGVIFQRLLTGQFARHIATTVRLTPLIIKTLHLLAFTEMCHVLAMFIARFGRQYMQLWLQDLYTFVCMLKMGHMICDVQV